MSYCIPADARAAATLLLLRDSPTGLEVLMLVRSDRGDGDPRSGAAVFPGGALDALDRHAHALTLGDGDAAWSARLALDDGGLDYPVAALRETFEEVGLLLAAREDGSAVDLGPGGALADLLLSWRERVQRGEASAGEMCEALGLRLDLRGVAYHSHWLTPPGAPKRFDTRFFMAAAPLGQLAVADEGEAQALMWLTPAQALEADRGLKLMPVTRRTLQDLSRFTSTQAALAEAQARRHIPLIMPRRAQSTRGMRVLLPDDRAYAEVARLDPDGRVMASCELLPGRAVRLSPNIWRVTAPNPGVMTGPGTNSYLVGAGAQWTVIDPGPLHAGHQQALLDAARAAGEADGAGPGCIERILVTHTHLDHSPSAAPLAAATGAPLWGRVADHAERQDASFVPAHEPQHGDRIALAPGLALRVIHTPGHASNHLCYLLESERLLFTGDQVMQGSTVIINPPDGDMAAYLAALQSLLDEDLAWLAPGHGFLVDQPQRVLRGLIAHRLAREGKVRQALAAAGPAGATIAALVPAVYDDVPAERHGIAARSLLAHLLKLRAEGLAMCAGAVATEAWRSAQVDRE